MDSTNIPMIVHNKCPAIILAKIRTDKEITLKIYVISSTLTIKILKILGISGGKKNLKACDLYNSMAMYCMAKNIVNEIIKTKHI